MTRIAVELVPRESNSLENEVKQLKDTIKDVECINIPDLLSCELRSWDGSAIVKKYYQDVIPHLRAMDFDFTKELPIKNELIKQSIKEVLVVEGDPPQTMLHQVYPTVTTDIIKKFQEELPDVKVYAGIDQYRSSMKKEEYRIRRKLLAGAKGFFTQPFFDMRYLEMYADMLDSMGVETIYWGVSPVLSARSVSYWCMKNNVVFPKEFQPTLEWNVDFARRVIAFAKKRNDNVYLMPIKANVATYLGKIFAE